MIAETSVTAVSLQEKSKLIEQIIRQYTGRKGTEHLYQASSELAGGFPTLKAAESVFKAAKNGGDVIIASGFTIISVGRCETDGPTGSVVVGKLINEIGGHLVFLTDPDSLALFKVTCETAGLDSFECLAFPIERDLAELEKTRLFSEFSPIAIIAIERPGWNWKGVHHNMLGQDISSKTAKVDYIFDQARSSKTLTIGIGDGGNEIGMGNILETIKRHVPFGSMCQCTCEGGIASVTRVDHLIVSSVSNWGAYGLAALLAELAQLPFEHSPSDERKLIKAMVKAGAVDGASGKSIAAVDGMDIERNAEIVKRIWEVVHD
jgi:hypothetical protein